MKLNKLLLPMIALTMIFVSCDVEGDTNDTTEVVFLEDFADGDSLGFETFAQNGAVTLSVEDGALKLDVTAVGDFYDPQFFSTADIPVINGKTYTLSFDVKSDEAGKVIPVNFGDKYDADPWWVSFWTPTEGDDAGVDALVITTTTEYVTHSRTFTMAETTTATEGCFAANLGTQGDNAITTAVYFDNITLEIVE